MTESTRLTNERTKTRADTSSPIESIRTVVLKGFLLRFLVANEKRVKESAMVSYYKGYKDVLSMRPGGRIERRGDFLFLFVVGVQSAKDSGLVAKSHAFMACKADRCRLASDLLCVKIIEHKLTVGNINVLTFLHNGLTFCVTGINLSIPYCQKSVLAVRRRHGIMVFA